MLRFIIFRFPYKVYNNTVPRNVSFSNRRRHPHRRTIVLAIVGDIHIAELYSAVRISSARKIHCTVVSYSRRV